MPNPNPTSPASSEAQLRARGNKLFRMLFLLLCVALVGYYTIPLVVQKASGSIGGRNPPVLVYPDPASYDPNPSACHDTWGCVNFEPHPDLRGRLPVYPSERLKHPTIIYRLMGEPSSFLVSIDGTNEGSASNPRAAHTMRHADIEGVPHGAKVRVRFIGGALSDLYGDRNLFWDAGSFTPRFVNGSYLVNQTSDGYPYEALLVRLATRSGKHTLWQKFCVMAVPYTEFSLEKRCGNYELEIVNELEEDAWLEFLDNDVWIWNSHLTGAGTLVRDYFAKGSGLNKDRWNAKVRYIYGQ